MKVCIVTTAFPRWKNDGRAAFMLEAALAIQRQGHEVRVIAMHNPGSKQHEVLEGIEIIRPMYLPEKWEFLQKDSAGIPQAWENNPWSRLAILPFLFIHTLAVAYWSNGFDVIHANWTLSGASAWFTQWIHHLPYIVTVQGSDIFKATNMWLPRIITRQVLKKAKRIIPLSNALADGVFQLGILPNKVIVIPNGVNTNKFTFAPASMRENIILFVGSLIERKGVSTLMKAFSLLKNDLPDYRMVLIGEGELGNSLEQMACDLELSNRVIFTGFQPQDQVHKWMEIARVFVLPSNEEGQGVVLLEAMASGIPCVGSRIGGIPDVITPDVGLLVPAGKPYELSRAIFEIANSTSWEIMSNQARQRAKQEYDWKQIVERISTAYQQVVEEDE